MNTKPAAKSSQRIARVNVKAVLILLAVVVVLGAGAVVGRYARTRVISSRALADGKEALARQDWTAACRNLRRYLDRNPDDAEILQAFAEAHLAVRPLELKHLAAAADAYRRLLRMYPGDARFSRALARIYVRTGNYGDAAYVCRQQLEADPNDAAMSIWLAKTLAEQQKPAEAIEVLEELIARRPSEAKAYGMLSGLLLQRDPEEGLEPARQWLDRGVEANPNSPDAHLARARFRRAVSRDPEGAREDLAAATSLKVDDPGVALALADAWLDAGELDLAESVMRGCETVAPDQLEPWDLEPDAFAVGRLTVESRLRLARRDTAGCAALAERALRELADGVREAFLPAAVELFLAAGEVTRARDTVEQLRKHVGSAGKPDASTHERLTLLDAAVAEAEDRPHRVVELLTELVSASPNNARGWWLLARALEKSGQARRARQAMETYHGLRGDDPAAALSLARWAKVDGRWADCLRYAVEAEKRLSGSLEAKLLRIEAGLKGDHVDPDAVAELAGLRSTHPRSVAIRVLQVEAAQRAGRVSGIETESALLAAVTECDDPWPAVWRIAELRATRGDFDGATAVVAEQIERTPAASSPRLGLAELLGSAGRSAEARAALADAMGILQGDERTRVAYALAKRCSAEGAFEEAAATLRTLAAERPDELGARLALLALPPVQADPGLAQPIVNEIKRIEGEAGLRWRLEQANLWLRGGDWRERRTDVEGLLTHCIANDAGWSAPVLSLGRLYELLGDDDRAENVYRAAFGSRREMVDVAVRLLALLDRQRRNGEIQALLDRLPSDLPFVGRARAAAALRLGDFDQATDTLRRQVRDDPGDVSSRLLLARLVYSHRKDFELAVHLLDEAEAVAGDRGAVLAARASLLLQAGRPDEARELLDHAVAVSPTFERYRLRAEVLAAIGQTDPAESDFRRLTEFPGRAVESYGALGSFYASLNRTEDAITAWNAGLAAAPNNGSLRRLLMQTLLNGTTASDVEKGRTLLEELLRDAPDDPDLQTAKARLLITEATPTSMAEAQRILEQVSERHPRHRGAQLQRVELARRRGDVAGAADLAVRAMGANASDPSLALVRAGLEADLGHVGVARELVDGVLRTDPRNVPAMNLLCELDLRAGEVAAAAERNRQVLEWQPGNEVAQVLGGRIADAAGRRSDAIASLEKFRGTPQGRRSVMACLALAEVYRKEKRFDRALENIESASRLAPSLPSVATERLRWLAAQDRYDEVRDTVAQLAREPDPDVEVLLASGRILASAPATDVVRRAPAVFDMVLKRRPDSVEAYLGMAQAMYRLGDRDAATRAYRAVLSIDPYQRQGLNDLAWILGAIGDSSMEALELADRGLDRYPDDPHLLDTRGAIYARLERWTEARRDLEQCVRAAVRIPGTQAKASLRLAEVAMKLGDHQLARRSLGQAAEIHDRQLVLNEAELKQLDELRGALR